MFERLKRAGASPRVLRKTELVTVAGVRLAVHPTVFHPRWHESSGFFAKHLRSIDLTDKRVLDCGTGTGILAIVAAQQGAVVTAIDINGLALDAARENAERNGVALRILRSDWFDALGDEQFDCIVCNPPFLPGTGAAGDGVAWHAGDGHEHVLGFIEGCEAHLAPGGEVLLVLPREADVKFWIDEFATEGLTGARIATTGGDRCMIFRMSP